MKKQICSLASLILFMTVMLCGCGSRAGKDINSSGLTKSEWIGLLGNKFGYNSYESMENFYSDVRTGNPYYDEIQACAEWGILHEEGTFHPDEGATWRYAIETSVRAIGLEKLNNSNVGMEVREENLLDFFTSEIANVDAENLDIALSETDALLILAYTYDYASELILAEKMEYTYQTGVKEASFEDLTLNGDGITASVNDGTVYEPGDVIYVEPSETNGAYAVRVNSVEGDEITYEQAGMEDIYEELQITGTFEGTVINVEAAENVNVSLLNNSPEQIFAYADHDVTEGILNSTKTTELHKTRDGMTPTGVRVDGNSVKFDANLGEGVMLKVVVSDITVTSDVDFGILSGLKKADVTLSFRDEVTAKYTAEHFSRQIPLGTVEVVLGSTPLTAKFNLVANIGFDGEVTLTYSSELVANVNYRKGNGLAKSVSNNNPACDFHAEATATVEPCIKAELCCLGRGLANVKVISGAVAIATVDADILGEEPACVDVYLYVPLRWAVNEDGCIMTSISDKLKASAVVWGSDNSPINKRFHWENGELVEVCTRGGEKVETETVDENGEPYDEYAIFDFEEVVFGFIKVASQSLHLSEGESIVVGILSVPEGYSTGELIYNVENTSVCSAKNGVVTAINPGSTTLQISTLDGKYSAYLSVVVEAEYNDTSGFQPL